MPDWMADAVAAEKGMTQGQGVEGKVEDGVTDGAANNFIDKELSAGETDMGFSNTGMEGTVEKGLDGFIDSKVDNEINENI